MIATEPLVLTKYGWWSEVKNSRLPVELADMLISLLSATVNSLIPPTATPRLIRLAKEHLMGGVQLGDRLYDIMVCVPNEDEKEKKRHIFILVPLYPGSKLMRLEEL